MAPTDRRQQYKAPSGGLSTPQLSQEARRTKALEEQKRRRAQRIDSARNLDLFAGLNLGPSDDEDDEADAREPVRSGVASFAPFLHTASAPADDPLPSAAMDADAPTNLTKKKRRKKRVKAGVPKPSKFADKCMYAELLEMRADAAWDGAPDGIPPDLESGWVSVAPVPAGKRCLAVTYQSSGVAGVVPNTHLRSRLLGKSLVRPFPSALPPQTVLDCILDARWRENGLLHVLDVVKWKGQDVGDCETPFRFWFRDSRLSEIPPTTPPPPSRKPPPPTLTPVAPPDDAYRFPYPCTFLPIPYDTDTSLPHLLTHTIPLARHTRTLSLPRPPPSPAPSSAFPSATAFAFSLPTPVATPTFAPASAPAPAQQADAHVRPDGLLLYVAQAAYEPGTSPLSSWVPLGPAYGDGAPAALADEMAWEGSEGVPSRAGSVAPQGVGDVEGCLVLFERLVRRRLAARGAHAVAGAQDVSMMEF